MDGCMVDLHHPRLSPQSEAYEWRDECPCTYFYEIFFALEFYSNHNGVLQVLTVF